MEELSIIGKSVTMIDAAERVTGTIKYTGDIQLPGMLYAKYMTSPHPHAKIKSIDTSKAEALPGVKAVITHKDCAALGWAQMDQPIISDTMRFVGDVVAAVAATDRDIAEEALDLIEVEYETLPFVLDPEEAMKPEAPQVHPEITDNNVVTYGPLVEEYGNIANGFAEADLIVEDTLRVQLVHASPAEPRVYAASWDKSGKLTVWASTQSAHEIRDNLAEGFHLPFNKVRIITTILGGGFGTKYMAYFEYITALLAWKADMPVQLALIEREELLSGRFRHPMIMKCKLGLKEDGHVTAIEVEHIVDTGAYVDSGIGVTAVSLGGATGHRYFRCPNAKGTGYPVYTNNPIAGAYRGYGVPQGTFALEMIMARAAEAIGMDPVEFALDDLWTSREEANANGVPLVASFGLPDCIRRGAEAIGWQAKWKGWDSPVSVNGTKRRGIGMAAYSGYCGFGSDSAIVQVYRDGTVQLITGVVETGGGQKTTLSQVCAEALGVRYEDINASFSDTDTSTWTSGTYASRIALGQSEAVKVAAEKAKAQLLEIAAGMLGVNPEELEAKDRKIYVKEDPENSVSLVDVLEEAIPDVVGTAATITPIVYTTGSFAAQFIELEVDTETGAVELLKVVAAHDMGRAINPAICKNQIDGGLMQGGLGYALTEEFVIDPATGATLNSNWVDYKVKTALDTPDIEPILVEMIDPESSYGIKVLGEMPLIPAAPAVLNAIRNAIGINFTEIPVTADKILEALGKV